jgi:hypothetical protein
VRVFVPVKPGRLTVTVNGVPAVIVGGRLFTTKPPEGEATDVSSFRMLASSSIVYCGSPSLAGFTEVFRAQETMRPTMLGEEPCEAARSWATVSVDASAPARAVTNKVFRFEASSDEPAGIGVDPEQ